MYVYIYMEWVGNNQRLILVGAIVLFKVFGSSSGCIPEEKRSLLDFKAFYSNESLLPSWIGNNPKSNCCDWERVTCNSYSGHVTGLSLEALNRKRDKYGYCLESARLNWTLFLSFKELSTLDLSRNCFEGITWNQGLCQMKQLTELHLNENDFEGTLDACLGNLTSLSTLDLSHNFLSGSIPISIKGMSSLKKLDLGHNNLSGNLPEIDECNPLSELMLNNNQLDGTLLRWIGEHSWVSATRCRNRSLFQGIYIIDLSHNKLSGELPHSFSMPLIFINLKGNNLTGVIPETFFDSPYLMGVDLSDNNFIGTIPESIYGVETLVFLLLAGNQLQGPISNQICQLQRVQILDLSHNNFTGTIPSCFNNMSFKNVVVGLNFSSVHSPHAYLEHTVFEEGYSREVEIITKGLSFHYQGRLLKIMTALDLSCNQLEGEIPQQIGDLSGLHALNLSHNHLNGQIPHSLHKLEKIESLDLSYNNLSGQIPLDLQDMYSLSVFNVSYNNLSGIAPDKGQFGTFDESSYRGNPYLTWSISNRGNATPSPPPPPPSGEGEKDDSTIDFTSFLWTFVGSYVMTVLVLVSILWMNPYWRGVWFYYVQRCLLKCIWPTS